MKFYDWSQNLLKKKGTKTPMHEPFV